MLSRIATTIALLFTASAAVASPPRCTDPLTAAQRQTLRGGEILGDPVLGEAAAVEEAMSVADAKNAHLDSPKKPVDITWSQAQAMIALGAIRVVFQELNLSVWLTSHSGHLYKTKEPALGAILKAADVADPCGVYIERVLE